MIYYEDKKYHFFELFNEENGTLIRSNILGTNCDANMRSFPELIDVGIMGHCKAAQSEICAKAGIDCYQNAKGSINRNMSVEDYVSILKQSKDKTFQIALGGAGDPNKHEEFGNILSMTRAYGIVPNMTTSGYNILECEISNIKRYCGAVAISYYSRLSTYGTELGDITVSAINQLVQADCETNIHYVISNDSIDEAIYRLEHEVWPKGINAIIFILYKPVGLGIQRKIAKWDNKLKKFLRLAVNKKHPYRVGFDTCFTSALVRYNDCIEMQSVDSCEAARFSMYIDANLNAYPCSFDNQRGIYKVSLNGKSIEDVWNGNVFESFRNKKKDRCNSCQMIDLCNQGCKLELNIDLCP